MTINLKPLFFVSAMLMGLALPLQSAMAQVEDKVQHVRIAPGDLTQALNQLASRFGVSVQFNATLTHGLKTQGVNGKTSLEQGFVTLLEGTGLSAVAKSNRVYVIQQTPQTMLLDPVRVQSTAEAVFSDAPQELGGFKADYQTTATKLALPLRKTPQAISVVTRDSLDARLAKDLPAALELTTGISNSSNADGTEGAPGAFGGSSQYGHKLTLRGQPTDILVDGFKVNYGKSSDIAVYERVEVIKGPSGFYGSGSLGGYINMARKKPSQDFAAEVSAEIGSYDTYRLEADVTGALNENKSITGRIVAAYEDAGTFVGDLTNKRTLLAPSFAAVFGDHTRLLLHVIYQQDEFDPNSGVPLFFKDNKLTPYPTISRKRFYGKTGELSSNDIWAVSLKVDHQLSDKWLASILLDKTESKRDVVFGNSLVAAPFGNGLLGSIALKDKFDNSEQGIELRLKGDFNAFGQEHKLVVGIVRNEGEGERDYGAIIPPKIIGPLDNFPPETINNLPFVSKSDIPTTIDRNSEFESKAVYAQLVFSLQERTNLLIGARYDDSYQRVRYEGYDNAHDSHALTARVGITHELSDNLSMYAAYAESFEPVLSEGREGILDPQTGEGYELGLKSEWFEGRLGVNAAVYRQELDNRPIPDPTNDPLKNESFSVSSGLHQTDGLELEVSGSPYPGLTIGVAATWMDNEFTEAGDPNQGLEIDGSFDQQFNAHVRYEWQQGALTGFEIGGSFVHLGERHFIINMGQGGGVAASLDGYDRVDLSMAYTGFANWELSLLLRNVLDEEYIDSASPAVVSRSFYGSPRAALLQATYSFN